MNIEYQINSPVMIALCVCLAATSATRGAVITLDEGKFGKALPPGLCAEIPDNEAYAATPLTVECWVKLSSKNEHSVLVSNEPKNSGRHWELYAYSQKGVLSAYLPGCAPDVVSSEKDIADGRWHSCAMILERERVRLFVDGQTVADQKLERKTVPPVKGKLCIGKAVASDHVVGCDGQVDEVRISSGVREIAGTPTAPFEADDQTIGLWHLDAVDGDNASPDASKLQRAATFRQAATVLKPESLDDIDRRSFKAGPSPLDSPAQEITLKDGALGLPHLPPVFPLSGEWQLIEGDQVEPFTPDSWAKAMKAPVPGSVHTALLRAGVIPDPFVGTNQEIAVQWSLRTYYYRKVFARPPAGQDETLVFEGICNRCTIWLNSEKLGEHEGMFDPVEFPVRERLKDSNTLIVKLEPTVYEKGTNLPNEFFRDMSVGWMRTVVFNNSFGWHYSKFPPLGIWQPVSIRGKPTVRIQSPFIATRDAQRGIMDLVMTLDGPAKGWAGKLSLVIAPDNFTGKPLHFEQSVESLTAGKELHFQFTLPDPKLWWPVDMGAPNLYRLKLAFTPAGGGWSDVQDICFGVRTVEMAPVAGKVDPKLYDWTFVINGRPMFVKGTGWCTMDAMMDFSRERYDRFLSLAADQHIQMLRAWGSGMVETDDFYDLCNRKGIMVIQEWPTAWNSHNTQPFALLERTVRYNVPRLRNHPSLVMYTGGNESDRPFGPAIDMMGRLNLELDGTREFHRGEPFGGSVHNYDVYWGGAPINVMFTMQAIFYGEFGIASYPVYESVQRFLPDPEKNAWPPAKGSSFTYHTPVFDTKGDFAHLTRMSRYFTEGQTMERFIVGTQLAQAVGVRHTLERMRTRWPQSTGALYYKLNDNSPAASWATVDWYGAPKIGHYLIQDSFAPLVAVVLFPAASSYEKALTLPVYLLDDADALKAGKWDVIVRAYGADLRQFKELRFSGEGAVNRVKQLGEFSLDAGQTKTAPLFMVLDVLQNGTLVQRNYNFTNFENAKDCLFNLPKTTVAMKTNGKKITVTNTGKLPAIGVNIARPGHLDTFTASDNYIWLNAGESQVISVNEATGLVVDGWNAEHNDGK